MAEEKQLHKLTRREFLKASAGVSVGILVSACVPRTEQAPGVSAPTVISSEQLENELNILSWGSYVDFAIPLFEQKYNCKVNAEFYGSEQEAMSKVNSAPGRYDIIFLGVGWLEVAARQGLLQPLDVSRLESYQDIYPIFRPGPFEIDGKTYGICYAFGTNAMMVNNELTSSKVDTWEAFWEPEYRGKTSLSDKSRDQYLVSMLRYGLDFNDPQEEDWEMVKTSIKDRAKNMRSIWSSEDEVKRLMISKEVSIADSYDGLTTQITMEYPDIEYVIPKEGTYGWFDGPEIIKDAPHPNLAYKWVDFVASAEVGKLVAENVFYAPGNSKVPAMLDPDLRTQVNLDNPEAVLAGLRFYRLLGPEWDRKISDAWTEAKAEAGD
jgi:spermidine/putrescine transport system substrate-binding protein